MMELMNQSICKNSRTGVFCGREVSLTEKYRTGMLCLLRLALPNIFPYGNVKRFAAVLKHWRGYARAGK